MFKRELPAEKDTMFYNEHNYKNRSLSFMSSLNS